MNPSEGASEEGGAADSDVDAFFRTGKVGQGSGVRVRAAVSDAVSGTSLGTTSCRRGVRVGGSLPRSSGLEL